MNNTPAPSSEMPFTEHLRELRGCLIRSLIGVSVATIVCYTWASELLLLLSSPLHESFRAGELIGTGVADAFIVKLKVSVAAGVILSCPWSFYQAWLFIAPGLHEHERRFAIPFIVAATGCFLLGTAFCFFIVFPVAFDFFSEEYVSIAAKPSIRIEEYLSFATRTALVFGGIFELPVFSYFLARVGMLKSSWLSGNIRYAIVGIFVIAGVLTPPDVVSQLLLAGPLLVIYFICYWITAKVERAKSRAAKPEMPVDLSPATARRTPSDQ